MVLVPRSAPGPDLLSKLSSCSIWMVLAASASGFALFSTIKRSYACWRIFVLQRRVTSISFAITLCYVTWCLLGILEPFCPNRCGRMQDGVMHGGWSSSSSSMEVVAAVDFPTWSSWNLGGC
ncbi:hypothetical protein ACLB2K_013378 [Fragaria x ananassa]